MRIQELINYSENQKMNNKDYDCRGVFQSFKVKKVSKFQSLKVLKFQSFKVKKGKYQRRGTARRAPTNLEFHRRGTARHAPTKLSPAAAQKKFQAKTMDCRSRCLPDHCASC